MVGSRGCDVVIYSQTGPIPLPAISSLIHTLCAAPSCKLCINWQMCGRSTACSSLLLLRHLSRLCSRFFSRALVRSHWIDRSKFCYTIKFMKWGNCDGNYAAALAEKRENERQKRKKEKKKTNERTVEVKTSCEYRACGRAWWYLCVRSLEDTITIWSARRGEGNREEEEEKKAASTAKAAVAEIIDFLMSN